MKISDVIFEAFSNGELINVLRGTGDYSMGFDQWVGAVAPTDWTKVLPLFYNYANKIGLENAREILENAILDLLNSSAEDVYIGVSVLYIQILREEGRRSPIAINREEIIRTASARILENESSLKTSKKWQGANNPDGLLTEVRRYQMLLKNKFGLIM